MNDLNDLPEILELETKKKKVDELPAKEQNLPQEEEDSVDQKLVKSELVNMILMYKIKFEKYLLAYEIDIMKLKSMSLEELETLYKQVELAVQCRNSTNMYKFTYSGVLETAEKVAPIVGMNLNGLSAVMNNNNEIQEILDEISIKYSSKTYAPPEIRLCFITLYTALGINSQNKKISAINKVVEEKVDIKIAEKYSDL